MTVVGSSESSPAGVISESEEEEPRFEVGSRVVYDPEAEVNLELEGDYTSLGVCTVTGLDVAAHGQLLSFVDERGDIHDGWWADRFKVAPTEATAEGGEDDVTYFVAFRSAAGYGYRVLDPRARIVTAADVVALTDLLAADVGRDVVPLNWIELPPPLPRTTRARQVAVNNSGSSTEIRSTRRADTNRSRTRSPGPERVSTLHGPDSSGGSCSSRSAQRTPRSALPATAGQVTQNQQSRAGCGVLPVRQGAHTNRVMRALRTGGMLIEIAPRGAER